MDKKSVLWILLELVFLIVFNTVFLVVGGTEHNVSVWLSYGFIHLAYLMVVVTPFLTRKCSSSSIFGFSIYMISSAYFLVELIVGMAFILFSFESIKIPLVVQIIIAGIYAILLLAHLIANEKTAESIERREEEILYIKDAAARVKVLMGRLDNKKADRKIEKVYDLLHSSPTKTKAAAYSIEREINNYILQLENAVFTNDINEVMLIAEKLLHAVKERNQVMF